MKLKNKRDRRMPEIELGAFSDIAFLLIIFFILTTTFIKTAGNNIEIPSGTTDESKKQKQITVSLKGDGIYYGENAKSVDLQELRDILKEQNFKSKTAEQRMVVLESQKDVKYDQYYKVVMIINDSDGILALLEKEDKK
jgi:biopolymer transport protein ExbD